LRSLAADKGYDSQPFRESLREMGIRPLVKHRVFAPYDHAHNARISDDLYNQRSMTETVNSSVKRSGSGAVQAREWYRGFREIVLMYLVYNIKQYVTRQFQRRMAIQWTLDNKKVRSLYKNTRNEKSIDSGTTETVGSTAVNSQRNPFL